MRVKFKIRDAVIEQWSPIKRKYSTSTRHYVVFSLKPNESRKRWLVCVNRFAVETLLAWVPLMLCSFNPMPQWTDTTFRRSFSYNFMSVVYDEGRNSAVVVLQ